MHWPRRGEVFKSQCFFRGLNIAPNVEQLLVQFFFEHSYVVCIAMTLTKQDTLFRANVVKLIFDKFELLGAHQFEFGKTVCELN